MNFFQYTNYCCLRHRHGYSRDPLGLGLYYFEPMGWMMHDYRLYCSLLEEGRRSLASPLQSTLHLLSGLAN